jgi:hypothetical protein
MNESLLTSNQLLVFRSFPDEDSQTNSFPDEFRFKEMEEGSVLGLSAPKRSRDRLGGIIKAVARPLGDSFWHRKAPFGSKTSQI